MTRLLSSLAIALPIAVALAGGALAQSNNGGGGGSGGSSSSGGEGANSGVVEPMTCATGAYCPPGREPTTHVRQKPPRRVIYQDYESCDQVRVREYIPGTNRYRIVYRCRWER